jgi:hypothetical protein
MPERKHTNLRCERKPVRVVHALSREPTLGGRLTRSPKTLVRASGRSRTGEGTPGVLTTHGHQRPQRSRAELVDFIAPDRKEMEEKN